MIENFYLQSRNIEDERKKKRKRKLEKRKKKGNFRIRMENKALLT